MLFRFAPGNMRKEDSSSRLTTSTAFNLDKIENIYNYESGFSTTLGLIIKQNSKQNEFDFSIAQVINEKENKKMASKSSLDEKLSDLVGSASIKINDESDLKFNFALDQNYQDFNYNEIETSFNFNSISFDFSYLSEKTYWKSRIF